MNEDVLLSVQLAYSSEAASPSSLAPTQQQWIVQWRQQSAFYDERRTQSWSICSHPAVEGQKKLLVDFREVGGPYAMCEQEYTVLGLTGALKTGGVFSFAPSSRW